MKSFFPYVGGKFKVAKRIIRHFPDHKCYVELFAGSANILFVKNRSKCEVINDANSA